MNAMLNIAEAHPYLCWLMAQLQPSEMYLRVTLLLLY